MMEDVNDVQDVLGQSYGMGTTWMMRISMRSSMLRDDFDDVAARDSARVSSRRTRGCQTSHGRAGAGGRRTSSGCRRGGFAKSIL